MNSNQVKEFIRKEIPDWDDEDVATARFKAFSGQRADWEPKFQFWKTLILKVARHLNLFIVQPSQVKDEWFNRGGLSPLCLDHVLFLMYDEGDVVRIGDLYDPRSARISLLLRKVRNYVVRSASNLEISPGDRLVLTPLVKEKAVEIVGLLSESHWTSSCIVTMKKLEGMCGGQDEASAVLSYLSKCGKAQYLSIKKKEFVEGVKVSISPAPVSSISSLDCDVLHLISTTEKLQQQIDVIDQRYEIARKSAISSLNSGNKKVALKHAREMKLASDSRDKCTLFFNRVEEVLNVIADAESTKKVSEAIQIGAQAMKQNRLTVEEVELCLDEIDECVDSQNQVGKALESTPSYMYMDDEDIEDEFKKLHLVLESDICQPLATKTAPSKTLGEADTSELTDSLSDALSNLKLQDLPARESANQDFSVPVGTRDPKHAVLETA